MLYRPCEKSFTLLFWFFWDWRVLIGPEFRDFAEWIVLWGADRSLLRILGAYPR